MELRKINKKAEGVSMTGTLAGLALLVILIVVLVFWFAKGSGSWSDVFGNLFGGTTPNVESVVQGCKSACSAALYNDYCTLQRDVIFVKKGSKEQWTCAGLEGRVPNVGLEPCTNLVCSVQLVKCKDLATSQCHDADPTKCLVDWIDSKTFTDYKTNNVGPGKTYVSIDDLTGYVTDMAEANQQKANGKVCVKTVRAI
ncbi:Uncharacterised protein [uncultured archaeon]|nr:Uncharacterised protein [uncultured archaeon]